MAFLRRMLNGRDLGIFVLLLLLSCRFSHGVESDVNCLESIKAALEDPLDMLSSWDFNNKSEGFICSFLGVECWHPFENKVLNIKLGDLGLKGQFPCGVVNCTSLTGLDLSSRVTGNAHPTGDPRSGTHEPNRGAFAIPIAVLSDPDLRGKCICLVPRKCLF